MSAGAYEDVLAKVAPIISPAMAKLMWAAMGAADDPTAWAERLRAACDEFNEVIRSSPDIIFRSREVAELDGLRVRTLTAEQDADALAAHLRSMGSGRRHDNQCFAGNGCWCGTAKALADHSDAVAARVAGETGDTP